MSKDKIKQFSSPRRRGGWFGQTCGGMVGCIAVLLVAASPACAQMAPSPIQIDPNAPVNFQAKQLFHDDENQIVTAIGDVELVQGARILRADKMVYHLDTDTVQAIGNVSLLDDDGAVHFAEYVELTSSLKDGFVQGLLSMLADGSRFAATEARREAGVMTSMKDASYTPCKVCEADPNPTWQIKADEVSHDEISKDIKYKNARFELWGVPFAWTPIFSHADPSVTQRSGFLRPQFGWTNNTGTFAEGGYYFAIAPDKDATVALRPTTRAGVLTQGEWRQRFENGTVRLEGSFARSDRREESGIVEENQTRGHVVAEGLFDINNKWRAGFDVSRVSDKEYLRLYDINKANTLQNEIYAERFSGRDYSRVSAVNVQDLRLGVRPSQPEVVPMAEHHMVGEPQSLVGGRWMADLSAVQLQRPGSEQDTQRVSAHTGWDRQDIMPASGIVVDYTAGVNGDAYAVQNNAAQAGENTSALRGHVYAGMTGSYPLVRRLESAQVVLEPVVGANITTNVKNDPEDFPNEDSADVQIDTHTLFSANRFPGIDRQEDGPRVNYGLRGAVHGDDGRYAKAFVGQSYRLNDNDGLFPVGSGLESHRSDIVGQFSVGSGNLNADYRIQIDRETLAAHRHELQASGTGGRLRVDTRFIYLDAIAGTGFVEPREQWQLGGSYRLTDNWTMSSTGLMDFGEEPGLRKSTLALAYADECFSFAAEGTRNLTDEASGESGTVVMLRVGLKNIGEFSSPEITLKPREEE